MKETTKKEKKKEYEIISIFKENGQDINEAIEKAFIKYLKYIDYE